MAHTTNQAIIEKMKNYAATEMTKRGLNGEYLKNHLLSIDGMLEAGVINCNDATAIWLSNLSERFLDKCSELKNVSPIGHWFGH